jgi:hypothetical protein
VSILKLVPWIGIATLSLSLSGCVDLCENDIRTEVASPDGTKRAVIFERSCGATTPFSTHVSVLNRGEALPRSSGNVFVADDAHGAVEAMNVRVRWVSAKHLLLSYPPAARIFAKNAFSTGVEIEYEAIP